jgi:preprotein translocase subunit SecB
MTDTENGTGPATSEAQPQLAVNAQYVKDFSFENPNAPQSLVPSETRPQIEVNVDVQARGLSPNAYEVALRITANARQSETSVFVVELVYGGLFTLQNVPQEQLEPVLLIECPRLLFPFARRIIADATRDGGFPPLLLDPIDFVQLYRRHRQSNGNGAASAQA